MLHFGIDKRACATEAQEFGFTTILQFFERFIDMPHAQKMAAASSRDGVAALFIGNGDWASAWSGQANISDRQRELSLRFGVNLVMVALTGNYKADQVHVPALLERMGRE